MEFLRLLLKHYKHDRKKAQNKPPEEEFEIFIVVRHRHHRIQLRKA